MSDEDDDVAGKWARSNLARAVDELSAAGLFGSVRIEGRVVWALRNAVLIAQVREDSGSFRWVITGEDVPTDHIQGGLAATPREALRHFCLKWQLGAENVDVALGSQDVEGQLADRTARLRKQAEDLYELGATDALWQ